MHDMTTDFFYRYFEKKRHSLNSDHADGSVSAIWCGVFKVRKAYTFTPVETSTSTPHPQPLRFTHTRTCTETHTQRKGHEAHTCFSVSHALSAALQREPTVRGLAGCPALRMVCTEPFTLTPFYPRQLAGVTGTEWSLLAPVGIRPRTDLINTLHGPTELQSHGLSLTRNWSSSAQTPGARRQLTRKGRYKMQEMDGI